MKSPSSRRPWWKGEERAHELLLQFGEPGVYDVWSDGMETIQFYGTGPKNQLLASFRVTDEQASGQTPIEEMTFTRGVANEKAIKAEDVMRQRHLVFDVDPNTLRIPFPQFKINDRNYLPSESWFSVKEGDVEEWIISNPSAGTHPFHIHVVPYQVIESTSSLRADPRLVPENKRRLVQNRIDAMSNIDQPGMWRDTFLVPPKGVVRLRIRFPTGLTGKTVFHCHFLAHEETGMLQNFVISPVEGDRPEDR